MSETWRPVVGYELHYEVSSSGRVRRSAGGKGATIGRILLPKKQGQYTAVQLCKNDRKRKIGLHILVAEAFHGPRPAGKVPNHQDLDKHNNSTENLEWMTQKENVRHAVANGAKGGRPMQGASNGRAKITAEQAEEIRFAKGTVSQRVLASRYGLSKSAVMYIQQGRNWAGVRQFPEVHQ